MHRLITGGARSGKSLFAESLLEKDNDVAYIASYIYDKEDVEMKSRIEKHQLQRNKLWKTYEVDYYLDIAEKKILFDCLSVFTSNVLFKYTKDLEFIDDDLNEEVYNHIINEVDKLFKNCQSVIIVTNEVGSGLVPVNHLERVYRDLLGRVNRYVASKCDEVYLVVCGQSLKIKGEV